MTDPYPHSPVRRYRRGAAATAAAALAGTMLAPALATGPAAAAPDCDEALPYRAAAHADLLRLNALDLPLLKLGPLVDARISSAGAGLSAGSDPAAAAVARDVELNLLGAGVISPLVAQQAAPPNHGGPVSDGRLDLNVAGILQAAVAEVESRADWEDAMACGAATGTAAEGSAALVDAALLPGLNGQALLALPDNLASRSETGLVTHAGVPAARAAAAASLADLRVFAGSGSEIAVKVISEPSLEVTATGDAGTSSVEYHAPVLEVTVPGVGTAKLDASQTTVDIALGGAPADTLQLDSGPVDDLLGTLGGEGLDTTGEDTEPALASTGLPEPAAADAAPALRDVFPDASARHTDGGLAVLRLSLGQLEDEVTDESARAAAASVRLQLLRWDGGDGPTDPARAVLDLGIGLLSATAEAPLADEPDPSPSPTPPPGDGGESGEEEGAEEEEELPVTGSTVGLVAGAGVLLAVAGRLLVLFGRHNRWQRLLS